MKKFLYMISWAVGLFYFMSPFIIKTAKTLEGRAAGELIGLIFIIAGYYGYKHTSKKPAYALAVGGVISIVWALVGGKIMHYGGTFYYIIFGIFYLVLAWLITHVVENQQASVNLGETELTVDSLKNEHGNLVAHFDGEQPQQLTISYRDILKLAGSLSYEDTKRVFGSLIKSAREMRKEEKSQRKDA